jgi:hypothetical protein
MDTTLKINKPLIIHAIKLRIIFLASSISNGRASLRIDLHPLNRQKLSQSARFNRFITGAR